MATEEQLKAAARNALAAGDTAAAKRLIAAARAAGAQEAMAQAPESEARYAAPPRADAPASPAQPRPYQNSIAGTAGQFGAGTQSGIARVAGFPVDAVTGAINGLGGLAGMQPIESPVGGSQFFDDLLAPFRAGISAPQSAQERFARRVGEEVGMSAAMFPAALAAPVVRAAPLTAAAVEGASALGSGVGAAAANEAAPGSMTAEIAGALLGGLPAGMAASRALGMNGSAPVTRGGIEEQRMQAADAYGQVRADRRVLPQKSVDDMALDISARMDAERLNPRLQPGSAAVLDAILQDSSGPMRIEDLENLRRLTTQAMPATASPADRRLGGIMTEDITRYLDSLNDPVADALKDGRSAYRRAMAAEAVENASTRASRRAARTGSGGNSINAMRQNLSSIVETPRKARSFKPDELQAMDDIVMGTTGQNVARRLSRFAPTSGGLSAMLGIGGAMANPSIALPIMALTEGAKAVGERSTKNSIAKLLQSLAPDRVLKPGEQGIGPVVKALLAARTMAGER